MSPAGIVVESRRQWIIYIIVVVSVPYKILRLPTPFPAPSTSLSRPSSSALLTPTGHLGIGLKMGLASIEEGRSVGLLVTLRTLVLRVCPPLAGIAMGSGVGKPGAADVGEEVVELIVEEELSNVSDAAWVANDGTVGRDGIVCMDHGVDVDSAAGIWEGVMKNKNISVVISDVDLQNPG